MRKYSLLLIVFLMLITNSASAQITALSSTFTYQGYLVGENGAVSGTCDFQFALYDTAGIQIGTTLTKINVTVANGTFSVPLDFGATAFDGTDRYLEIAVRCPAGNGTYTTLTPRQALTAAPYALGLYGLEVQYNVSSPNLIGGAEANIVANGIIGATISGGGASSVNNLVSGNYGTVSGGVDNQAGGSSSTISGGNSNSTSSNNATIGGGFNNTAGGYTSTIGGGYENIASGELATIGGGWANQVRGLYGTIAGGGPTDTNDPSTTSNHVTDNYGSIGGGGYNRAGNGNDSITDSTYATVGGGGANSARNIYATVSGGATNTASGIASTVSGGEVNTASAIDSTVGGGSVNTASGEYSTISGGSANTASGYGSAVGGGIGNIASAQYSMIPGGYQNTASALYSFAAGFRARSAHVGAFVWADSSNFDILSTAANQFTVRAVGGAHFISAINNSGVPTAGVTLAAGGGSWSSLSDQNAKENILPIDPQLILQNVAAMPISTWNYIAQDDDIRHIGPMAQDFQAAFGVGEDNTRITTIDADGVALAAIQGLNQLLEEKEAQIAGLQQEVSDLQAQNQDFEARLAALEGKAITQESSLALPMLAFGGLMLVGVWLRRAR